MQEQINALQADVKKEHARNEALKEELRSVQKGGSGSSNSGGGGGGASPEMVKKRSFEQLVKEVDQCFDELGRQVQRESKHRQSIEQQVQQLELALPELGGAGAGGMSAKTEAEIDRRLSKCEASASELKKDLKKEKKKLEKVNAQVEATHKSQIDQSVIEETIPTILVDVVDELTENKASNLRF